MITEGAGSRWCDGCHYVGLDVTWTWQVMKSVSWTGLNGKRLQCRSLPLCAHQRFQLIPYNGAQVTSSSARRKVRVSVRPTVCPWATQLVSNYGNSLAWDPWRQDKCRVCRRWRTCTHCLLNAVGAWQRRLRGVSGLSEYWHIILVLHNNVGLLYTVTTVLVTLRFMPGHTHGIRN